MKSKFAKFIDGTVGALLIFFAATAVMRYYTTLELAAFSAAAITACVCLLLKLTGMKREDKQRLSRNADNMFFDFMFADDDAPVKLLYNGLKTKTDATLHGKGVYANKTAAFCFFGAPPDQNAVARTIAKAKHFGANKVVLLCKTPPSGMPEIDGISVKAVGGEDVYKLFGSLGAMPRSEFSAKRKSRRAVFRGALGKDKILRYALLSAGLFASSALYGFSIVPFACAVVCSALALAALFLAIADAVRTKRAHQNAE